MFCVNRIHSASELIATFSHHTFDKNIIENDLFDEGLKCNVILMKCELAHVDIERKEMK